MCRTGVAISSNKCPRGTAARISVKIDDLFLGFQQGVKEGSHLDSASSTWIRASDLIKNMRQMIFIMVMF